MKRTMTLVLVGGAFAGAASAGTVYDTSLANGFNVGSGIPNANFAVNTNDQAGVETGLTAFYRFGVRGPGDFALRDSLTDSAPGVTNLHTFRAGESFTNGSASAFAAGTASWNFAYSIDLDVGASGNGRNLSNQTVLMTIDWDPTAGENLRTYNFSAVAVALGAGSASVLQDAQNLGFLFWNDSTFLSLAGSTSHGAFDPNALGTYRIQLDVVDNASGDNVSSIETFVTIVPTPTAMIAGLSCLGLAGMRRRR